MRPLTSSHQRIARALALCALLMLPISGQPADHVLDWTTDLPKPSGSVRIMGSEAGSHAKHKALPLEITLLHIGLTTFTSNDRPIVEVLLKNMGDSPFLFPTVREQEQIVRPGYEEVQMIYIGIEFAPLSAPGAELATGVIAAAFGSPSVPGSLLTLLPGQTVRITSRLAPFGVQAWGEKGLPSVSARAIALVSASDIKPEKYTSLNYSGERKSKNSIEILWKAQAGYR